MAKSEENQNIRTKIVIAISKIKTKIVIAIRAILSLIVRILLKPPLFIDKCLKMHEMKVISKTVKKDDMGTIRPENNNDIHLPTNNHPHKITKTQIVPNGKHDRIIPAMIESDIDTLEIQIVKTSPDILNKNPDFSGYHHRRTECQTGAR